MGHVHFTREVQRCVGTRLGLGLAQLFGQLLLLLLNLMAVPDSSQQFPTISMHSSTNPTGKNLERSGTRTIYNLYNNIEK